MAAMPNRPQAWLASYGLLGFCQNGLAPILLPLVADNAVDAGIAYAVFALAGVAAPLLGTWADRTGQHRNLLVWGGLAAGLCFLGYAAVAGPLRILMAAGAGLGTMAGMTAGNVLAIQGRPRSEWDEQIARLQRFISAGQVIGLLAAGLLVRARPGLGFLAAALALFLAAGLAARFAPGPLPRDPRDKPIAGPAVGGDAGVPSVHHHGHRVGWRGLRIHLRGTEPALLRFVAIWLVAYPAMNGIATMFPVAMTRQFGMDPIWASGAYALGVGISLGLYGPVGAASHQYGGKRILMQGFGLRVALFAFLAVASTGHAAWTPWLVLLGFGLTQVVWPLLSVAANSLSVELAPNARGEGVGLFNAATSLASSIGSALAGMMFGQWGFAVLAAITCAAVGIALVLAAAWLSDAGGSGPVGMTSP